MRVGLRLKWSDRMKGLIFGLREPILDLRGRTLGLRKLSFGPERVNLEPEWGLGGLTYVQTNGRTPVSYSLQDIHPLGRAQKAYHSVYRIMQRWNGNSMMAVTLRIELEADSTYFLEFSPQPQTGPP